MSLAIGDSPLRCLLCNFSAGFNVNRCVAPALARETRLSASNQQASVKKEQKRCCMALGAMKEHSVLGYSACQAVQTGKQVTSKQAVNRASNQHTLLCKDVPL